jgi:hypothetical protein
VNVLFFNGKKRKKECICIFFFLSPRVNLRVTVYRVNVRIKARQTETSILKSRVLCVIETEKRTLSSHHQPNPKSNRPSVCATPTSIMRQDHPAHFSIQKTKTHFQFHNFNQQQTIKTDFIRD